MRIFQNSWMKDFPPKQCNYYSRFLSMPFLPTFSLSLFVSLSPALGLFRCYFELVSIWSFFSSLDPISIFALHSLCKGSLLSFGINCTAQKLPHKFIFLAHIHMYTSTHTQTDMFDTNHFFRSHFVCVQTNFCPRHQLLFAILITSPAYTYNVSPPSQLIALREMNFNKTKINPVVRSSHHLHLPKQYENVINEEDYNFIQDLDVVVFVGRCATFISSTRLNAVRVQRIHYVYPSTKYKNCTDMVKKKMMAITLGMTSNTQRILYLYCIGLYLYGETDYFNVDYTKIRRKTHTHTHPYTPFLPIFPSFLIRYLSNEWSTLSLFLMQRRRTFSNPF